MTVLIHQGVPFNSFYGETHFKFFSFQPSFLFKKEPEILFDMPRRVAYLSPIPILLHLNDIDRFPVTIDEVTITVSSNGKTSVLFSENDLSQFLISHPLSSQSNVYHILLKDQLPIGKYFINCYLKGHHENGSIEVLNDNLMTSSKIPFTVQIKENTFPGKEFALFSDVHVHSQFSRSHVEYAAPVETIALMGKSLGLSFIPITDHSYDLQCKQEDYLQIDHDGTTWQRYQEELKKDYGITLIPSEEVSCKNHENKTIHLGAVGITEYIPGSADGARKNRPKNDLTIPEVIQNVKQQKGISFAAHPGARMGWLQRTFLQRGNWEYCDIDDNLDAFQALNSGFTKNWYHARSLWIKKLLSGRKLPLLAGNDAHGDFNRYRAIKLPFLSIYEDNFRYFGNNRTGLYTSDNSQQGFIDAIKEGKTFITNGPFINIYFRDESSSLVGTTNKLTDEIKNVTIEMISDEEFGFIKEIKLFTGDYPSKQEHFTYNNVYDEESKYSHKETISTEKLISSSGYIRAELTCYNLTTESETKAITSPIYFTE